MPTENIANQDFDKIPSEEKKPSAECFILGKFRIKQKTVLVTIGVVAVCLIAFLVLNILVKPKTKLEPPLTPIPTSPPTLAPVTAPSLYATDSAILSLEEEIKKTENDLLNTDLKESRLNPPALDMNIKF